MTDDFRAMINRYRERMALLRDTFQRQGYLLASSTRDPDYSILLSPSTTPEALWRVTSFRLGEPTGHREYDALDVGSPTQRAFQEFAGETMVLRERARAPRKAPLPVSGL